MANPDGGTGFPGQIQARDSVTKAPIDLFGDEEAGALKVALYCWDTDSLEWVRQRQPQMAPGDDDDDYHLYEYDGSGNLLYRGSNAVHGASQDATTWVIQKYTWGANGLSMDEKLTGAWSNRSSLAWV